MSDAEMEGREPDGFEVQLTQALRRVDAPEGFAARVMERAANSERAAAAPAQVSEARPFDKLRAGSGAPRVSAPRVVVMMPRRWTWVGGAIAAVLVLGVFGTEQVHERHQRAALAQQQFETATRITDQALEHTREQLARAGVLQDE